MKKITVILFLVCICFFFNSSLAYSEVDTFLRIEGIRGESIDDEHREWIDVLAWSWQMSLPNLNLGVGAKAIVRPLIVKKYIDKASPHISLTLLKGEVKSEAILVAQKSGEKPFEFLRITMSPVWFVNVSPGGTSGEDRFTESVALAFSKVCYAYTPQKVDGSPDATIERCFNIEQNIER